LLFAFLSDQLADQEHIADREMRKTASPIQPAALSFEVRPTTAPTRPSSATTPTHAAELYDTLTGPSWSDRPRYAGASSDS
jgi:hypothetical protein